MEQLLEYKWLIVGVNETVAWIATFMMFYGRYGLKSTFQFKLYGLIALITGYVPHIFFAVYDIVQFKKLDTFLVFIIVLFFFGILFGKRIARKIDHFMMEKFNVRER